MNLLIWDFDGTLAYRDGMWSGALVEVLNAYDAGHPITREDIRPHLRRGFPWHSPDEPHRYASQDAWWAALEPVFAGAYVAAGVDDSRRAAELATYVRGVYCDPSAWTVYPDVGGVLESLQRDGWIQVILSNHVPELEDIVAALGLRSSVSAVFSSATTGYEKPNAAAFRHAISCVGVPERVWMIGDNPVADIGGAAAVGIPGILVRDSDPRAPRCCGDLTQVRGMIDDGLEGEVRSATDSLGLKSGTVRVVPYDARWETLFDEASRELWTALGTSILAVYHIGSTAVPGLCAKPVLDLLASVSDFEEARELIPYLEALGYEYRPDEDIPDRHYFRRRMSSVRTHHLSLAEPTSRHHKVTLVFRDALRADPDLAAAYAQLKLELAQRFPNDRSSYLDGKSAFIEALLARAGFA